MKHPPKGPPPPAAGPGQSGRGPASRGAPPPKGAPPAKGGPSRAPLPGRPQSASSRPAQIAQRPQFDVVPEPLRAARAFLMETFGQPERALAFGQPDGQSALKAVDVALFGQAPSPHVLASAGASSLACKDGARREWLLILKDPPDDGHFTMVADVAASGRERGAVLEVGPSGPMSALLLLDARALPEEKRAFERKDGTRVELGWIIPVFAEEARYARERGADALFAHWEREQPDLTDLRRKPSVPSA